MQNSFFTPIKTVQNFQRQLFNSDYLHRDGDWICINCQNLNYSFRKKCNRCKTQSRHDNDNQHSVYSYYYYPNNQTINTFDLPEFDHISHRQTDLHPSSSNQLNSVEKMDHNQNEPLQCNGIMQTPKKKKPKMSPLNSKLDGLPSVSPLVKKYRQKQHHTTLEVNRFPTQKLNQKETNVFELSNPGKDFNDFNSIKIRDFDQLIQDLNFTNGTKNDIENSPLKDNLDEEDIQGNKFMKEIQESISRIII